MQQRVPAPGPTPEAARSPASTDAGRRRSPTPRRGPSADPDAAIARALRLGHRPRHSLAHLVQRRMVLDDADLGLYVNEKERKEEKDATPYVFLGKSAVGAKSSDVFLAYSDLARLGDVLAKAQSFAKMQNSLEGAAKLEKEIIRLKEEKKPLARKRNPEDVKKRREIEGQIADTENDLDELQRSILDLEQKIQYEALAAARDLSLLEEEKDDVREARLKWPIVQLLIETERDGPLIRQEGGGSRLPPAKGKLVLTEAGGKEQVLKFLASRLGQEEEEEEEKAEGKDESKEGLGRFPGVEEAVDDPVAAAAAGREEKKTVVEGEGFAYVSDVAPRDASRARIWAAGQKLASFDGLSEERDAALAMSFQGLATGAVDSGWVDQLDKRDRGRGQLDAMGRWNALGAAAYTVHKAGGGKEEEAESAELPAGPLPLDQGWEWLHVRGAQIGGATDKGNLLAGTYAANSEMIPYESQIQQWYVETRRDKKKRSKPGKEDEPKVEARFSAQVRDGVLADQIRIQVAAQNHQTLGTIPRDKAAAVDFFPLQGRVVDKFASAIERAFWLERLRAGAKESVQEEELAPETKKQEVEKPPPVEESVASETAMEDVVEGSET